MIDWGKVRHFSKSEFNEEIDFVKPELIYTIDDYRDKLDYKLFPSPVKGAWARFDGSKTSRHYAVDRLSDAGDLFLERECPLWRAFLIALSFPKFGGIGIYFDTKGFDGKPQIMFHVDLRPTGLGHYGNCNLFWFRDKTYHYPQNSTIDMKKFIVLMNKGNIEEV